MEQAENYAHQPAVASDYLPTTHFYNQTASSCRGGDDSQASSTTNTSYPSPSNDSEPSEQTLAHPANDQWQQQVKEQDVWSRDTEA